MEPGEELEHTAKRELKEETGLSAVHLKLLSVFSGKDFYYKYPHGDEVYNVIAAYICDTYEGTKLGQAEEVKDSRFFHLNNLPKRISPHDKPILEAYKKAIGMIAD